MTALQQQALVDALQNAEMRLAEEEGAYAKCVALNCLTDARFAKSEIVHYAALILRLRARLAN